MSRWTPRAKNPSRGPYAGVLFADLGILDDRFRQMVGNLCIRPEGGVDHGLLAALKSTYDLDDLFDLLEISEVEQSWRDATQANIDRRRQD